MNRLGSAFSGPGVFLPRHGVAADKVNVGREIPVGPTPAQPSWSCPRRLPRSLRAGGKPPPPAIPAWPLWAWPVRRCPPPSTAFSNRFSIRSKAPLFCAPPRAPPLESVPTISKFNNWELRRASPRDVPIKPVPTIAILGMALLPFQAGPIMTLRHHPSCQLILHHPKVPANQGAVTSHGYRVNGFECARRSPRRREPRRSGSIFPRRVTTPGNTRCV